MANYFGISDSSVSTLFSSLGSSNASGSSSILADYYSIRNGSYKKLLSAYYSLDGSSSNTTTGSTTSTSSDSTKLLSSIEKSADALKDSTDALLKNGDKSVFNKDKDGKYDVKAIYEKVSQFVEDYNDLVETTEKTNTKNIATQSLKMMTTSKVNESLLSKIGITIDKDGAMSIDKEKFENADMSVAKSLFNGVGSYGYQISVKASMINYYAEREATKSNTYTNAGSYSYNYSAGNILDKLY